MTENKLINTETRRAKFIESATMIKARIPTKQVKSFWGEFRDFAFKGNIIELAVGVVIGTGFNNLVQSLVANIIMPPIGKLLGNSAFTDLFLNLSGEHYDSVVEATVAGAPIIKYGLFFSNVIDFIIMALTIFIVIRFVLRIKKDEAK